MAATSAVTLNYVKAREIAVQRLDEQVATLELQIAGYRRQASRGGLLTSAARDTAAQYIIDGLMKAVDVLTKNARVHRETITALRRAPCPACHIGQRAHCVSCGSCPKGGPSCMALECESIRVPV